MKEKTKKIIFVCTGNTCRSPMAEALFRSEMKRLRLSEVEVSSAGLSVAKGDGLNPYSALTLAQNGLSLENFQSRQLTFEMFEEADAIVCMTEKQRESLTESVARFGDAYVKKIHSYYTLAGCEIPDPYGKDLECYRIVFEKISSGLKKICLGLKLIEERQEEPVETVEVKVASAPKKRGRPRKNTATEEKSANAAPKKRGRPKKVETPNGKKQ